MKIKPVTPRVSPQALAWITDTFKNPTHGAGYCIEAFHVLYAHSMYDLKGQFGEGELSLMIDVFNGTMLTPGRAGQQLLVDCVDGMALNGLDEKWNVDRKAFTDKLKSLTLTESACIEIWANGYWYGGKSETTGELADFNNYIANLLRQAVKEE